MQTGSFYLKEQLKLDLYAHHQISIYFYSLSHVNHPAGTNSHHLNAVLATIPSQHSNTASNLKKQKRNQ